MVMNKYNEFNQPPPPKLSPFDPSVLPTRPDLVDIWLPLSTDMSRRSTKDLKGQTCQYMGKTLFLKSIDLTKSFTAQKELFVTLAKEMMEFDHPNVVAAKGLGLVGYNTKLCVAMEYMDQGSLLNVISNKDKQLTEKQMWQMCLDISLGLQYLHKLGHTHGNLSTKHVLINSDGQCKLNVQAIVQPKEEITRYGAMLVPFCAPETLKNHTTSLAADIYSLAIVFGQIFTRKTPYYELYNELGYVEGDLRITQSLNE
ncbi:hypothetical protein THRCLA_05366, partial [Thraustotheca clavata]